MPVNDSIKMHGLVSIIVPVYNTARFLDRCLTSLLEQSCREIEILAVDNGSTDDSGAILDGYAQRDPRVRVVHKAHGYAGSGRNAGLDAAGGEYVMFVDSDDYVAKNYVERLLSALLEHDAEIAQCCFYKVVDGEAVDYLPYRETRVCSGRELSVLQASFVGLSTPQTVLWNKLYRREIFDALRFTEERELEDMEIAHRLLYPRKRVVWIPDRLYYWVIHEGSHTTSSTYRPARCDEIWNYRDRIAFFRQQGDQELEELNMKRCCYVAAQHIAQMRRIHGDAALLDRLHGVIREFYPRLMAAGRFGWRTRARVTFIRLFPAAFGNLSLKKKLDFRI